jgi:predicted Rdx family selenoprotein
MSVTIHYCKTCGFLEHAEGIAAALETELGLTSEFQPGFWGTFRIDQGETEIFNRWKTRGILGRVGLGRTPTPGEIVELFRERNGGGGVETS